MKKNDDFEPSASQKRAREIMGYNYFGIEEAIRHFKVNPSKDQLAVLSEVPFTEVTLEECKKTHILVAVFPMSIFDILDIATRGMDWDSYMFYDADGHDELTFAQENGEMEWQLVRKTPVDGSISKMWQEQQALLGSKEETPTTRVMIYTVTGHFLATGEQLFEEIYVRCSNDVSDGGPRIAIGPFDSNELIIEGYCDGDRHAHIGVASARKFD